ncbi:hypothetical protein [Absidia glauca]|uniref:Glycine zipper 2TM domain-containing protein n=1 Tax=Absidia glauca TaxID=4829 RepID=A0A163M2P6_ABSGL|nr:hypothetical protein [Absidia glauca]
MVMKLTLLAIVLAACLVIAVPVSYKDAVGASSAALIIHKNLAKREGPANFLGEATGGGIGGAIGGAIEDVRNGLQGRALIIEVAKRGAV